jgi:hypothetical protein
MMRATAPILHPWFSVVTGRVVVLVFLTSSLTFNVKKESECLSGSVGADVNTILAGPPCDDESGTYAGATYATAY